MPIRTKLFLERANFMDTENNTDRLWLLFTLSKIKRCTGLMEMVIDFNTMHSITSTAHKTNYKRVRDTIHPLSNQGKTNNALVPLNLGMNGYKAVDHLTKKLQLCRGGLEHRTILRQSKDILSRAKLRRIFSRMPI